MRIRNRKESVERPNELGRCHRIPRCRPKYAAVTFFCAASVVIKNTDDPIKGSCLIKNGVVFSYMLASAVTVHI